MRTFEKLWSLLFVALVQLPVAAVIGALVGEIDLAIWVMAIAAHHGVRSATGLPLRRRLGIWLLSITAGTVMFWFGAIVISRLMASTADAALAPSGQVTSLFWFVVAIRLAIRWVPVVVAWVVSAGLARRYTKQRSVLPVTL